MASVQSNLENVLVGDPELWRDGPPHELFRRLRAECPVHWTAGFADYPQEPGYWSVTRAQDIHTVSRDWPTFSSELGGVTSVGVVTPRRIAAHEPAIRTIVVEVLDRLNGREHCDLVTEVAQPVVSRVICSFMGIPPEDDAIWARIM